MHWPDKTKGRPSSTQQRAFHPFPCLSFSYIFLPLLFFGISFSTFIFGMASSFCRVSGKCSYNSFSASFFAFSCISLDKSALKSVTDKEVYDLSPTWENYARLTDNEKGLGLARSVDNYDRMTLLHIMDKGYPRDGLIDEYPDNFSFHEKFERIENKLFLNS